MTTYSNETNRFLQDIAPKAETLTFDTALYNYSGIESIGSIERKFPIANMGMFTCFGDIDCIQQKNLGALGKMKMSDKENVILGSKLKDSRLKDLDKILSRAKKPTKKYIKDNKNDKLSDAILLLRKKCKDAYDKTAAKYKKNPIKGAKYLKKVKQSDNCVARADLVDLAYAAVDSGKQVPKAKDSKSKDTKTSGKRSSGQWDTKRPKPGDKGPRRPRRPGESRPTTSGGSSTAPGEEIYGPPLPDDYPQGGELEPFDDSCEEGEEKNEDGECVKKKGKAWVWLLVAGAVGVTGFLVYETGVLNPMLNPPGGR